MDNIAKFERRELHLSPGKKLISADEYCEYKQASDIVSAAIGHAERIENRSKSAYEIEEEYGYQAGLDRAKETLLERQLAMSAKAVLALSELEQGMVQVVTQAVEKIVGEMDQAQRIRGVVSQLMAQTKEKHKLTLRVGIDSVSAVEAEICNAIGDAWSSLDVKGDNSLDDDSFILETASGVIDGSIKNQLKILAATLSNIFHEN